jgi:hypothetical protein
VCSVSRFATSTDRLAAARTTTLALEHAGRTRHAPGVNNATIAVLAAARATGGAELGADPLRNLYDARNTGCGAVRTVALPIMPAHRTAIAR